MLQSYQIRQFGGTQARIPRRTNVRMWRRVPELIVSLVVLEDSEEHDLQSAMRPSQATTSEAITSNESFTKKSIMSHRPDNNELDPERALG
jgi:hypothetical protein